MKPFLPPLIVVLLLVLYPSFLCAQQEIESIPPTFDSLIQVSRAYTAKTEFDSAFAVNVLAKEMALDCCGAQSAAYASYCFNEGRINDFMSRDEEAIVWYKRSLELRGEILGTTHIDYGKSLNNLATVYVELGQFAKAEPVFLESLKVRELTAGRESTDCARVLYNLSGLYLEMGDFERAELMALEAKGIRERLLGKQHELYARSLINLANISYGTQNYERSLSLSLEAKGVLEMQEALPFYTYVQVLDDLGAMYGQIGNYEESEVYYQQAADLRLQVFGENSSSYSLALNHLASVYRQTERYKKAEEALEKSLVVLEEIGQAEDNDYAYSLQDLADIYVIEKRFDLARELQNRALTIIGSHFPKYHPRYLRSLRSMAQIEERLGNDELAANLLRELASVEEKTLANAVRHLSEEELANFTKGFESNFYQYFSLAEHFPGITDVCYNKILLYKGFLQTKALELQQMAQYESATNEDFQQLRAVHDRLAALYVRSGQPEEEIVALEAQAYELEKSLVRQNAALRDVLQDINWQMVQGQLTEDAAAIEFVDYSGVSPDDSLINEYAALLLLPGTEIPIFIPLCQEDTLKKVLANSGQATAPFINALYGTKGAQLYQLLWAPIARELQQHSGINTIHYAAAGLLHRVNLAAIPTPDEGKVLAQRYELIMLGSTRQLAEQSLKISKDASRTAVLFGGINYGSIDALTIVDDTNSQFKSNINDDYPPQRGYDPDNGYWQQLSWTEVEVVSAEDLLNSKEYATELRIGDAASEASFKALNDTTFSPTILHIATHGFFFPKLDEEPEGEEQLAFRTSKRAMIRSGLVMADGNYAWTNGRPRQEGDEDGILTAFEVSRMDLQNTELVILSACETGLGDIKGREGVYGLQRAFKIAGARYLIMTLWQVPDFETQAFMTTFYLAWIDEGKTIPEAFRAAQMYMRARYKDAHKWAGFVLIE